MRNRILQFFILTGFSAMLACEPKPAETTAAAASPDGIDRTVFQSNNPQDKGFQNWTSGIPHPLPDLKCMLQRMRQMWWSSC